MTSPDWLSPGIDGGKREDPRPPLSLSSIPERRGRASGAVRPPVSSQGRTPPLQGAQVAVKEERREAVTRFLSFFFEGAP